VRRVVPHTPRRNIVAIPYTATSLHATGATYLEEAAQWFAGGADSAPPSRDNGNALSSSCLCASMQCMLEAAALRVRCDSLDTAMDTLTKAMGQSQARPRIR